MFIRKIIRAARDFWFRHRPHWGHEDSADLQADAERLDREEPGWDHAAKVASAQSALRLGLPRHAVADIYGEAVAAEAEKRNQSA